MKLGIVLEHWDSHRGGLERWTTTFVRWLLDRGHSVEVLARSFGEVERGIDVARHFLTAPPDRWSAAAAVDAHVRSGGCDSYHDLGVGTRAPVLHLQSGSRWVCRRAESMGRVGWDRWRVRWSPWHVRHAWQLRRFERWQFAAAGGLWVVPSNKVIRNLHGEFGVDPGRIRRVPNAVDTAKFRPAPAEAAAEAARSSTLVFLARNPVLKGLPDLLRALAMLAPTRTELRLIVGGVSEPARMQAFARRLGIAERVEWLGRVDDVRPLLHRARLLVHPSRFDAGSLVLWESWACGCPVVASPEDGSAEALTPGREGWMLARAGDVRVLAATLDEAFNDGNRLGMTSSARALAESNPLDGHFERLLGIHIEGMGRRRAGEGPAG